MLVQSFSFLSIGNYNNNLSTYMQLRMLQYFTHSTKCLNQSNYMYVIRFLIYLTLYPSIVSSYTIKQNKYLTYI